MVTQEVLIILLLLLFIKYSQRVTLLALKPVYQVALLNSIYNIDSNIYNIIQIKVIWLYLGCINTCTRCNELRFDVKLILS